MTRQHRTFTPKFKLQLVKLYEKGKSRADIAREYEVTPSALDCWIKNHQETSLRRISGEQKKKMK